MTWCSWDYLNRGLPEAGSEPCQISKIELSAKTVNEIQSSTIFTTSSIFMFHKTMVRTLKYCYWPDSFVILDILGGAGGGGGFLLLSVKLWLGVSTDGELRTGLGLGAGGARSRVSLEVLDSLELLTVRCRDEEITSLFIWLLILPSCFLKKSVKKKTKTIHIFRYFMK